MGISWLLPVLLTRGRGRYLHNYNLGCSRFNLSFVIRYYFLTTLLLFLNDCIAQAEEQIQTYQIIQNRKPKEALDLMKFGSQIYDFFSSQVSK
jgi:hypothetical protein